MKRTLFKRLTQAAICVFTANTMAAEAPRWYEVELALISYQDGQAIDDENWSDILSTNIPTQETLSSEELSVLYVDESIIGNSDTKGAKSLDKRIDVNSGMNIMVNPAEIITQSTVDSVDNAELIENSPEVDPWAWVAWWNNAVPPENVLDFQKGGALSSQNLLETPFADTGKAFEDQISQFKWAKGLKMVWNKKWRQPIPEKGEATAAENLINIDIKTELNSDTLEGTEIPLVEVEIKGNLHLYRSRYLHLVSNLAVQHWQNVEVIPTTLENIDLSASIELKESFTQYNSPNSQPILKENAPTSVESQIFVSETQMPVRAALIQQSRRMRSTELHYIDHPMVGILVRITPIEGEDSE